MRRRTSSVAILCLLVVSFLSLLAIAEITAEPKITSVRIVSFKVEEEPKPVETSAAPTQQARGAQRAPARGAQPPAQTAQPAQESSVTKKPPTVTFTLSIEGENLPNTDEIKEVMLLTDDPAQSVGIKEIVTADGKEMLVTAAAKAKTKINEIRIVAKDSLKTAHSTDFTIAINENPPKPKTTKFDMKLEHDKNKQFPDVHTVILTKEGGEGEGFDLKATRMAVDLQPSGATDIVVIPRSHEQLDLRFFAPADYEPTSAHVTVYTTSDLETREVARIGEIKKKAADPNEPKVTKTEIVFINRSHGTGRLRIYGQGFPDFGPPPYQADDYLWNCLEEFHIRGTDRYALLTQQLEFQDIDRRLEACQHTLDLKGIAVQTEVDEAGCALEGEDYSKSYLDEDADKKSSDSDANKKSQKPKCKKNSQLKGEVKPEEEPEIKTRMEDTKTNLADLLQPSDPAPGTKKKTWKEWEKQVRDAVDVSVHSRNPDIQVERVEVINLNDKMMDVYFEFTRNRGFSMPFRLESSTITVRKNVPTTTQTVTAEKVTATVSYPKEKVYIADYQIEPKRDPNLTYKYTILDNASANSLLGKGVADNFYVIQLSIVNNSDKKIAIPLASIQAEVEWVRGVGSTRTKSQKLLIFKKGDPARSNVAVWQGPPTIAPVPLATVSSNFDAYQKVKGLRAHVLNGLDAATIMATALVPFTGPSFKDAEVFFSGGFIPGVRKGLGDLSSQQLQNLTSLSWESSQTVPAQGGPITKYVYIQKRSQQFTSDKHTPVAHVPTVITSQIAAILGLEVTGFEVKDSEAKTATEQPKTSSDSSKASSSDQKSSSTPSLPSTPPATGTGTDKK